VLLFGLSLFLSCTRETPLRTTDLTCEYLKNPPVVDVIQPRLSWVNVALKGDRGQKQTAFQIRVASSEENLERPDLWDSEMRISDQSIRVMKETWERT